MFSCNNKEKERDLQKLEFYPGIVILIIKQNYSKLAATPLASSGYVFRLKQSQDLNQLIK